VALLALQNLPPGVRLDLDRRRYDAKGNLNRPPNDGSAATPLAVGLPLDRFGSPSGRYFSP
jgi:hypothetical protein